jgi:hypothetical protein
MSDPLGDTAPHEPEDEARERVRRSDVPIYTELAVETGVDVPDPLPADPLRQLLGAAPHPDRDVAATRIQPAVARGGDTTGPRVPPTELGQDDLTAYDRELDIVNTPKIGPVDEVLHQPPQDPGWRPFGETV